MAERVCPIWVGYLLANPLRKLFQNPNKILGHYVDKGMTVLDVGCAMGFFSLPIAKMVGEGGKVICVDLQKRMIRSLQKRARKVGLSNIDPRVCSSDSLGLGDLREAIDLALAFAVVHEVPDASSFFSEVYDTLKPTGKFLVVEPKGHVSENDFGVTIKKAEESGFNVIERPQINRSRTALFGKTHS